MASFTTHDRLPPIMSLYIGTPGLLLAEGGALAVSQDCCCVDSILCGACLNARAPTAVRLTVAGIENGHDTGTLPPALECFVCVGFNGEWVIPFDNVTLNGCEWFLADTVNGRWDWTVLITGDAPGAIPEINIRLRIATDPPELPCAFPTCCDAGGTMEWNLVPGGVVDCLNMDLVVPYVGWIGGFEGCDGFFTPSTVRIRSP